VCLHAIDRAVCGFAPNIARYAVRGPVRVGKGTGVCHCPMSSVVRSGSRVANFTTATLGVPPRPPVWMWFVFVVQPPLPNSGTARHCLETTRKPAKL
jgi:hypothetical protein